MPQPKDKDPSTHSKPCTLCQTPRDVLVRCQVDPASLPESLISEHPDAAKPGVWHFVCPGSCWKRVSGGVIDGDLQEGRQGYRYGGMWKNKHVGVSAKVPRRLKGKMKRDGGGGGGEGKKGEGEGEGEEESMEELER